MKTIVNVYMLQSSSTSDDILFLKWRGMTYCPKALYTKLRNFDLYLYNDQTIARNFTYVFAVLKQLRAISLFTNIVPRISLFWKGVLLTMT